MRFMTAAAALGLITAGANADILLNQTVQSQATEPLLGALSGQVYELDDSDINNPIWIQRQHLAADDFQVSGGGWSVTSISTYMHFVGETPLEYRLDIFGDNGGQPGALVASFTTTNATFNQIWNGRALFEVNFDLGGLNLADGTYWASSVGIGDPGSNDVNNPDWTGVVYWATSNRGNPNGSGASGQLEQFGFTDWTPYTSIWDFVDPDFDGLNRDMAMLIQGTVIPSPGALALIGLAGLLGYSRRRRS